jgi:hypothetical protein
MTLAPLFNEKKIENIEKLKKGQDKGHDFNAVRQLQHQLPPKTC